MKLHFLYFLFRSKLSQIVLNDYPNILHHCLLHNIFHLFIDAPVQEFLHVLLDAPLHLLFHVFSNVFVHGFLRIVFNVVLQSNLHVSEFNFNVLHFLFGIFFVGIFLSFRFIFILFIFQFCLCTSLILWLVLVDSFYHSDHIEM